MFLSCTTEPKAEEVFRSHLCDHGEFQSKFITCFLSDGRSRYATMYSGRTDWVSRHVSRARTYHGVRAWLLSGNNSGLFGPRSDRWALTVVLTYPNGFSVEYLPCFWWKAYASSVNYSLNMTTVFCKIHSYVEN